MYCCFDYFAGFPTTMMKKCFQKIFSWITSGLASSEFILMHEFKLISKCSVRHKGDHNGLKQQSPTFLAPWTSFVEDNFSTDWGRGDGLGMIQVNYIYCAFIPIIITSAPASIIRH